MSENPYSIKTILSDYLMELDGCSLVMCVTLCCSSSSYTSVDSYMSISLIFSVQQCVSMNCLLLGEWLDVFHHNVLRCMVWVRVLSEKYFFHHFSLLDCSLMIGWRKTLETWNGCPLLLLSVSVCLSVCGLHVTCYDIWSFLFFLFWH